MVTTIATLMGFVRFLGLEAEASRLSNLAGILSWWCRGRLALLLYLWLLVGYVLLLLLILLLALLLLRRRGQRMTVIAWGRHFELGLADACPLSTRSPVWGLIGVVERLEKSVDRGWVRWCSSSPGSRELSRMIISL